MRLLAALLIVAISLPAQADESVGFGTLVWEDTKHVMTAPSRWEESDWQDIGLASLTVVGTAILVDKPMRDHMRKQDQNSQFWLQVEKFGREYAVVTMGGLFIAGAMGNEKAMSAAQDSFIASLIASGIITSGIKYVVGRARPLHNKDVFYSKSFTDMNSSFPSGHSTQAFALASVLAEHYDETWQQATFYSLATLAALARPYHDKHYASDILAAGFIGTWVGKSVVKYNKDLRSSKIAILPELAPGMVGVRFAKSF